MRPQTVSRHTLGETADKLTARKSIEDMHTDWLIDELRNRGYIVRKKNECATCGQIIEGQHFCPGIQTGDHVYERKDYK